MWTRFVAILALVSFLAVASVELAAHRSSADTATIGVVLARPATRDALADGVRQVIVLTVVLGVALARPAAAGVRALLAGGMANAFGTALSPPLFGPLAGELHIPIEGQSNVLVALAACAVLHLSLVIPARHPLLGRLDQLVPRPIRFWCSGVALLYAATFGAMLAIQLVPYADTGGYDAYFGLAAGLVALLFLGALGAFIRSYRHPPTPLARAQLRWLVIGLAPLGLAFAAQSAWTVASGAAAPRLFGLLTPNLGLLLVLAMGLAVVRYRLFDVDRVLRLTITWLVLSAVLLVGFVGLALFASRAALALLGPEAAADPASSVVAALMVAAVAYPAHRRLVETMDRLVFRERAARRRLLEEAANVLGRAQPPEVVIRFLTQDTPLQLGLQAAWVALSPAVDMLADDGTSEPAPRSSPLFSAVAEYVGQVTAPLVLVTPADRDGYADINIAEAEDPALATWYSAGARVLVALRADSTEVSGLVGIWALSARTDQELLARDDLHVLNRISKLAALLLLVQAQGRERERMQHELDVAREIQQTLIPGAPHCLPGWQVTTHYQAARQVGGDFYDFVDLPGGRLGLAIGDVSGKGIPAALVMARTQSILRATAASGASPGNVLERANMLVRERLPERIFVTCQYAVLDLSTGRLQYANAGHCPPYVRTAVQPIELAGAGLPLGVAADAHYTNEVAQLEHGDCLVLYSDGILEAHSPSGEMFGLERMAALVGSADRRSMRESLLDALGQFRGSDALPEDDVTLVIVERE